MYNIVIPACARAGWGWDLVKKFMHNCRKRFGQNFLLDNSVIEQIIHVINPKAKDHLIEIGPGLGAITKYLLPLISRLDAIELDRELIPKLIAKFNTEDNFAIHQGDILKFDLNSLIPPTSMVRVVGNLPYNISTPLLFYLLSYTNNIIDMHFMLQKEVALRLAANPGSKDYGRLSIMIQYHCKVNFLFEVKPTSFRPMPKVNSAFVRLTPLENAKKTPLRNFNIFQEIISLAFNQRRKTIQNSLKSKFVKEDFVNLNINPVLRPEQLSIEHYIALSNYLALRNGPN